MIVAPRHLMMEELTAGLDQITQAPSDNGVLEMIVRRPAVGEREVIEEGQLAPAEGLVGDNWSRRGAGRPLNVNVQLTLMNARVAALVAQERNRWPLAGDQLFVDLDLSAANLPPGSHLTIGSAVIRVSEQPHTGCAKFVERFGMAAMEFVNGTRGKALHLRGINARVIEAGTVRVGDRVRKQSVRT
ncbi:MAG TPA: MOSC domain-containing protein [Chloroflexota bacterium]